MLTAIKTIIAIIVIIFALKQPVVINALIAFLFAGVLPGTNIILPFWATSLIALMIGFLAIRWLMKDPLYIGDSAYQQKQAKAKARNYVLSQTKTDPRTSKIKLVQRRLLSLKKWLKKRRKRKYQTATSN